MARRHDAPGQGFLFGDQPARVNKVTPGTPDPFSTPHEDAQLVRRVEAGLPERIPKTIDGLIATCALGFLNPRHFGYRPGQVECIADICATTANIAVKGGLGSGKTNVALAVAARSLHAGDNVLYLTPFDKLVEQTEAAATHFLTLPKERLHAVREDWSPTDRATLYNGPLRMSGGRLVISTPGKILNDLSAGRLPLELARSFRLAIFDECHLAFGRLPYVELMQFFSRVETRLIGFTGTMGKDREQRHTVLENLGVETIYTLNSPPLKRTIVPPRILDLGDTLTLAAENLSAVAKARLTELADFLEICAGRRDHPEVLPVVGRMRADFLTGARFDMPVKKAILALHHDIRGIVKSHPHEGVYFQAVSRAYEIDHLQQLHERLTRYGRYAFLRLAADKLLALNVPELRDAPEPKRGRTPRGSALPRYIEAVYRDTDVLTAYATVAAKTPFALVPDLHTFSTVLRAFPGVAADTKLKGTKVRGAVLDSMRQGLLEHPVSDHPKEAELFRILDDDQWRSERKPTIVFVGLVDSARFLVDRINRDERLGARAALFIGAGHKTGADRSETIRRFEAGEIDVIVATSALETGQDTQAARRVVLYTQTSEAISLAQRMGRAGRSGHGGEIVFLVTKHYERQYFAGRSNLRKMNGLE
jgi:ERCC4-related helicase